MKYRYLGKTGLLVSRLSLGTLTLGADGWGCNAATSVKIIRRFLEAGGNFIDSADIYSKGISEEIVGKALKGCRRDDVVLGSKCLFRMGDGPNDKGLGRKHILAACENSLRRLQTDYIDIYTVHGPDPFAPLEETMRTLDDLVRQGKVRYIGCSNFWGWQVLKANGISDRMNLERFVCGQYPYNLLDRTFERELLPALEDQGMGFNCWSPLAGGLLTGKYRGSASPKKGTRIQKRINIDGSRFWSDRTLAVTEEILKIADNCGLNPMRLALSWLLHDRRISAVIFGVTSLPQLEEILASGDFDLEEEIWRRVKEVSEPEPDALLKQDLMARNTTFGEEDF
jgi:1-deoxyxylulose-5-phosphate synthase